LKWEESQLELLALAAGILLSLGVGGFLLLTEKEPITSLVVVLSGITLTLLIRLNINFSLARAHEKRVDSAINALNSHLAGESELWEYADSWVEGAKHIEELEQGDELLACASNPWPTAADRYRSANKTATGKHVEIRRIFGRTPGNLDSARNQLSQGICTEAWMYDGSDPMINYIVARRNETPKWAIVWIAGYPTMLGAVLFHEGGVLTRLVEDFERKKNASTKFDLEAKL
jgi:hypothetical protein